MLFGNGYGNVNYYRGTGRNWNPKSTPAHVYGVLSSCMVNRTNLKLGSAVFVHSADT